MMKPRTAHWIAMLVLIIGSWQFALFALKAYNWLGGWIGTLAWMGLMAIAFIFNQLQYAEWRDTRNARKLTAER